MTNDELSYEILKHAYTVHTHLGPGLLENTYRLCLKEELEYHGFKVETEKAVPLIYREKNLEVGFRMDLLVENRIVIELKAIEGILPIHKAQLINYLKLGNYETGLLINFNEVSLKSGIHRLYKDFKKNNS